MKEKRNLHLKLQEFCDCYANTDPIKEMATVSGEADPETAALKWLALAALHGITTDAKSIAVTRDAAGGIAVGARHQAGNLPGPGRDAGGAIIDTLREITHIDAPDGHLPLSLGIRDGQVDLDIRFKTEEGSETATVTFPE